MPSSRGRRTRAKSADIGYPSAIIRPRHRILLAFAVFVLLAAVHTWPLASDPAHLSRVDPGDGALNIWAIGWVAHELPRHPLRLFEANIFYPEHLTLAYSEAMIVQGALAMPIVALGGSAVLAYNLVLMAGLALTGWAFCLLTWRWTGSWSAGFVAGSLAAFNAHALVRFTHLQAQHVEFVAVMLFALDRLVVSRRFRDALLLGAGFALQGLSSVYLLVFSTWTLIFAVVARAGEWLRAGAPGMLVRFGVAGGLAALLMAPYLYEYERLHQLTGWTRGAGEQWAAATANYLATGARLHYNWWSKPFAAEATSYTFPGFVALLLVGAAFSFRDNRQDPRFRMCVIVGAGCAAVSFAPSLPFYPLLHRIVPLFQAVRVPAHLGQFVLLMIAVLAGFGVASLQRGWKNARTWPVVAVVLCVLTNGEALRAPVGWVHFDGVPEVYAALGRERAGAVAELPFPIPTQWFLNTPYMVNSTVHFRPLLNGYSGFRPPSYDQSYAMVQTFPDDRSLIALHDRGVSHVVVHKKAFIVSYGQERFDAIAKVHTLQVVAADDDIFIYRLDPS